MVIRFFFIFKLLFIRKPHSLYVCYLLIACSVIIEKTKTFLQFITDYICNVILNHNNFCDQYPVMWLSICLLFFLFYYLLTVSVTFFSEKTVALKKYFWENYNYWVYLKWLIPKMKILIQRKDELDAEGYLHWTRIH